MTKLKPSYFEHIMRMQGFLEKTMMGRTEASRGKKNKYEIV